MTVVQCVLANNPTHIIDIPRRTSVFDGTSNRDLNPLLIVSRTVKIGRANALFFPRPIPLALQIVANVKPPYLAIHHDSPLPNLNPSLHRTSYSSLPSHRTIPPNTNPRTCWNYRPSPRPHSSSTCFPMRWVGSLRARAMRTSVKQRYLILLFLYLRRDQTVFCLGLELR